MAGELERVRKALRELGKSLESLHGESAPKEVHKLRTASRRVEAIAAVLQAADGKKSRRLVKSIEPVRKAAGGVRDMDVLLADARKLARYRDRRFADPTACPSENCRGSRMPAELQHALHHRRKAALEDLKEYSKFVASALRSTRKSASRSGADANQSQEKIHTAAMDVVRELGDWHASRCENLHEFRLKVKELRYTLQLDEQADAALVEALGDVQRRIGDWHDWQQLRRLRTRFCPRRRPRAARPHRRNRRSADSIARLPSANALRGKYLAMPVAIGHLKRIDVVAA